MADLNKDILLIQDSVSNVLRSAISNLPPSMLVWEVMEMGKAMLQAQKNLGRASTMITKATHF